MNLKFGRPYNDVKPFRIGDNFIFPIVRRMFPNMLSMNIVPIQPIPVPTGGIYYFDLILDKDFKINTFKFGR